MKTNLLKLAEELDQKWEDDDPDLEARIMEEKNSAIYSEILEDTSKPYHGYIADSYGIRYDEKHIFDIVLSNWPHYDGPMLDKPILTKVGFLSMINALMQDLKRMFPGTKIHARQEFDGSNNLKNRKRLYEKWKHDPQMRKEIAQNHLENQLKSEPLYVEVYVERS